MANLITINGEQRLELLDEEIGRKISIGSSWNHIRIGVRLAMDSSFSTYINAPPFICGLCNGDNNMFYSKNTNLFVGIYSPMKTWALVGNSVFLNNTSANNDAPSIAKKINEELETLGSVTSEAFCFISENAPIPKSGSFALDIIKGNPNWEFNIYYGGYNYQSTRNELIAITNVKEISTSSTFRFNKNFLVPYDSINEENNGYLDTINIGWYSPFYKIQICDVIYSIFE